MELLRLGWLGAMSTSTTLEVPTTSASVCGARRCAGGAVLYVVTSLRLSEQSNNAQNQPLGL